MHNARMEAKKYCFSLLVIFVCNCQFVKCFNNVPFRFEIIKNDSETVFSYEKEIIDFCDVNNSRPRVSKCCDLGFGYSSYNKSCVETIYEFLPDFEDCDNHSEKAKDIPLRKRYEYFIDPCGEERYLLEPDRFPEDKYIVYSNGILTLQNNSYEVDGYCLETVDGIIRAFFCFESKKIEFSESLIFKVYASGLMISIPFLITTAMLYFSIAELRDLKGKSLICHCSCLAFAYFFLAIVQLGSGSLGEDECEAFGFLIQYFFVAAFMWLNVLSYDTWKCIKNDINCKIMKINFKSENLIFIGYCMYGFFGPTILTILSLLMSYETGIPESYVKPKFGFRSCWFHSSIAALSYFYGPLGIIILINLIFFVLSAFKIYKSQKEQMKIISKKGSNKETQNKIHVFHLSMNILKECVYLFLLMGLNFLAEILSWAFGTFDLFWMIIDFFNLVQGITIFFLFVLKPVTVRKIIWRKMRLLYYKIIKCNWNYTENQKPLVPPHWHADTSSNFASRET